MTRQRTALEIERDANPLLRSAHAPASHRAPPVITPAPPDFEIAPAFAGSTFTGARSNKPSAQRWTLADLADLVAPDTDDAWTVRADIMAAIDAELARVAELEAGAKPGQSRVDQAFERALAKRRGSDPDLDDDTARLRAAEKRRTDIPKEHKATLLAWSPASYAEGKTRSNANVTTVGALVLDVDDGAEPDAVWGLFAGHTRLLHTSWSHTDDHAKCRLVVPLAEPVSTEHWPAVFAWAEGIAARAGITVDPACKDSSRLFFLPALKSDDSPRDARRDLDLPLLSVDGAALALAAAPNTPALPMKPTVQTGGVCGEFSVRFAAMVDKRCATLESTPDGGRSAVLQAASRALGGLLHHVPDWSAEQLCEALQAAADAAGMERETDKLIRGGIEKGQAEPLDFPPSRPMTPRGSGSTPTPRADPRKHPGVVALVELGARLDEPEANKQALIGAAMMDTATREMMGLALHLHPAEAKGAFLMLRAPRDPLRNLQSALRASANGHAQRIIAEARANRPAPTASAIRLDGHGGPDGLQAPAGWIVDGRGVLKDPRKEGGPSEVVAPWPLLITGISVDLYTEGDHVRLSWLRCGEWRSMLLSRPEAAASQSLVRLASERGAPVNGANAMQVMDYLLKMEAINLDAFDPAPVSSRTGWQSGEYADEFVPLSKVVAGHFRGEDEAVVSTIRERGTMEEWMAAVEMARPHESALLGILGSLAAPLVRLATMDEDVGSRRNMIIDWSGSTGKGKSTTGRIAASCWGVPDTGGGFMQSWGGTPVGIERRAQQYFDLPVILDDTKQVQTHHQEWAADFVYDYANGQARTRGKPDGMRRTAQFRGVMLSSGEQPLTSFTRSAGASNRVLAVRGQPFGSGPGAGPLSDEITHRVRENYGHAGPKLIQYLRSNPEVRDGLPALYRDICREVRARPDAEGIDYRLSASVALLELTRRVLVNALGVDLGDEPIALAISAAKESARTADQAAEAVRALYSWAASQKVRFWGSHETKKCFDEDNNRRERAVHPPGGFLGAWEEHGWTYLALRPESAMKFLLAGGWDKGVVSTMRERGWLMTTPGESSGVMRTRIDGARPRCWRITREAIDLVLAPDDDGDDGPDAIADDGHQLGD